MRSTFSSMFQSALVSENMTPGTPPHSLDCLSSLERRLAIISLFSECNFRGWQLVLATLLSYFNLAVSATSQFSQKTTGKSTSFNPKMISLLFSLTYWTPQCFITGPCYTYGALFLTLNR